MPKYCDKCKKKIDVFSKTYPIDNQVFCRKCANNVLESKALEKTLGWYSIEDIYYSGLVVENGVRTHLALKPVVTKEESENTFRKINDLPSDIKNKILEVPQFKIFFKNDIPYYITQNDPIEKKLPKSEGCYYDPVKDTEAYKIVVEDVIAIAVQRHKEHMIKHFGSESILGDVHIYYAIEAHVLYDKYGILCVNNPMSLNHHLFID